MFPFVTVTSPHVKFAVVSLNVHVTIKLLPVKYVLVVLVNVTVGAPVSNIIVSLIIAVLRFPHASLYLTYHVFVPSHALHHEPFTIFRALLALYVSSTLYVL